MTSRSRRARTSLLAGLALASAVLVPLAASAQTPAASAPASDVERLAEALFDEAKAAMDAGAFDVACPKFEESRRLDRAGGTDLALGVCYERAGRLASAWYAYREALAAAQRDGRTDRESIAHERLADIEPRLSRVTVLVPAELAAVQGLRIVLGATELRPPSWGLSVPYDAGTYELRVSAPGYETATRRVVVRRDRDDQHIDVPMPARKPAAVAAPPARTLRAAAPLRSRASRVDRVPVEQKLGFVFAGAAAAALVPGIYYGGRAIARGEDVDDVCDGDLCPSTVELDHRDARSDARRANVLVAAGLAALGVSIYWFLTSPPSGGIPASATSRRSPRWRLAF